MEYTGAFGIFGGGQQCLADEVGCLRKRSSWKEVGWRK